MSEIRLYKRYNEQVQLTVQYPNPGTETRAMAQACLAAQTV